MERQKIFGSKSLDRLHQRSLRAFNRRKTLGTSRQIYSPWSSWPRTGSWWNRDRIFWRQFTNRGELRKRCLTAPQTTRRRRTEIKATSSNSCQQSIASSSMQASTSNRSSRGAITYFLGPRHSGWPLSQEESHRMSRAIPSARSS